LRNNFRRRSACRLRLLANRSLRTFFPGSLLMSPYFAPLVLADIFDRFRLQISDKFTNALTPIWILCVGAAAGLVLIAILWGLFRLLSMIPGVGTLAEHTNSRRIAIAALTVVMFVLGLTWMFTAEGVVAAPPPLAAAAAGEGAEAAESPGGAIDSLLAVVGILLASLLLATAFVTLSGRRALAETNIALREGVLWPLMITALVMTTFAVLGMFIVRRPVNLLENLVRAPILLLEGDQAKPFDVPAAEGFDDPPEVEIPVNFRKDEIRALTVASNQRVKVRSEPEGSSSPLALVLDVAPGEPTTWRRERAGINPFREDVVTRLYAVNNGSQPAQLTIRTVREVANREMLLIPFMAVAMAVVFFAYMLQRAAVPKLAAVALSTTKSDIAQPLYPLLMVVGIVALILFVYIPYNTFGDDIKQLKEAGLSLILVLSIIQAVWAASTSVADEVEGKTALTVLSKPVSRRDFILGKFFGISWSVGLMIVILGLLLLVTVSYKPIYDYKEGAYEVGYQQQNTDPTWQDCHREMVQVVPGLTLVYLEALVIAALSVAISTRLPALANFIICFAIYVLGHLTPLLVQSSTVADQLPPVIFFGRLITTVLPVLDHFNIQASVAAGIDVPLVYLAWVLLYTVIYSGAAMLLALTLFEDRDLA
jgi:hypothetical protein